MAQCSSQGFLICRAKGKIPCRCLPEARCFAQPDGWKFAVKRDARNAARSVRLHEELHVLHEPQAERLLCAAQRISRRPAGGFQCACGVQREQLHRILQHACRRPQQGRTGRRALADRAVRRSVEPLASKFVHKRWPRMAVRILPLRRRSPPCIARCARSCASRSGVCVIRCIFREPPGDRWEFAVVQCGFHVQWG